LAGAFARAAELMDAHPEVGLTFGRGVMLHDSGTMEQTRILPGKMDRHILKGMEFIKLSGPRNIVCTPTAVVRTELQKRLGGYRIELPHTGDMEMWLRIAAHSSVAILESYQAVYRNHAENMSLVYFAQNRFLDLQQRKAALDWFFRTCEYILPDAQRLRSQLVRSLGCDAVHLASGAFNDGQVEMCERLSESALALCPQIKRSIPWILLVCKRHMGLRLWRTLQPVVAGIRSRRV